MSEQNDLIEEVENWPPFSWAKKTKRIRLLKELNRLTKWHYCACKKYAKILDKLLGNSVAHQLYEIPFLPVRLFKHEHLSSVESSDIVKTMTSSGTSGQSVSQIFLDKKTASLQTKVLTRIMSNFLGRQRLPMLVIDCRATVANRQHFSARTAGILGFSMFGRDVEYALDDDMVLNEERVRKFLDKYLGLDILIFGFTSVIWKHLILELESNLKSIPLQNGILVHGGGWKQLQSQAVSVSEFKNRLRAVTQIARVHNYYGMVEQTGSIFMECEAGFLHTSSWSEIIIRNPSNFRPLNPGQSGLIQLLSVIPHSYPGHSLLSEDEGEIIGVDDCVCGRKGTYFIVHGRLENAETRGCSDTYTR